MNLGNSVQFYPSCDTSESDELKSGAIIGIFNVTRSKAGDHKGSPYMKVLFLIQH